MNLWDPRRTPSDAKQRIIDRFADELRSVPLWARQYLPHTLSLEKLMADCALDGPYSTWTPGIVAVALNNLHADSALKAAGWRFNDITRVFERIP